MFGFFKSEWKKICLSFLRIRGIINYLSDPTTRDKKWYIYCVRVWEGESVGLAIIHFITSDRTIKTGLYWTVFITKIMILVRIKTIMIFNFSILHRKRKSIKARIRIIPSLETKVHQRMSFTPCYITAGDFAFLIWMRVSSEKSYQILWPQGPLFWHFSHTQAHPTKCVCSAGVC